MTHPPPPPAALELRGVSKRFGAVTANDGVSLAVPAGTIHALVGENGAGKSTAMRIAYGMEAPDAGEVLVDGVARRLGSPQDAIRLGIGMVHQHFMLVEAMTVTENVVLGAEPGRAWAVDHAAAAARVAALGRQFGLAVEPGAVVGGLSVGERQRVELLKALYRHARLLILDEPTAVLAPQEVAGLFAVLRRMRAEGRTVVLITHKLAEVLAVADAVTVMRAGRVVASREIGGGAAAGGALAEAVARGGDAATLAPGATTVAELARWMIGKEAPPGPAKRPAAPGAALLEVENLTVAAGGGRRRLDGISFTVHAGEILGVAGVEGNGQSELLAVLAGLVAPGAVGAVRGRVRFAGHDLAGTGVRRRQELGIAHVPEDRRRCGLLLDFDLAANAILGRHDRPPVAVGPFHAWLDRAAIARRTAAILERFGVQPARPELPARALSGGNQQKLVLGRELSPPPRLLLAAQPTRGVDLGGAGLIHRELLALRDGGGAVLLVSSDLDELLTLADRLLVLHRGRLAGELDPAHASPEQIGQLMTGGEAAP
jgi:simple sugar transport system ATP-binding protein